MKFGGTSVGSSESIQQVVEIINQEQGQKIVVLSAFSGVTNLLVQLNNQYQEGNQDVLQTLQQLESRCFEVVNPLFQTATFLQVAQNFVRLKIEEIKTLVQQAYQESHTKTIIAQGEIISTHIFQFFLQEKKIESSLISALDFMVLDKNQEPDTLLISKNIQSILKKEEKSIFITQGFICRDFFGNISNLDRGGSDYSASLIGAAVSAEQIQIWTDIDGMHNNDPRYVENTFSIKEVSFDEAAELAYFGAKILHPQSLIPAKNNNIPVLLKNTFSPAQKGTLIKNSTVNDGVTSVAAKDGITAIKIKSYRMLLAYGFLKKVFEVFETYQTPIDMITTSEVAVSLTIDNNEYLSEIVENLQEFGTVEVDKNLSIVCVAGDFSQNKEGISAQVFNALKTIPIRMISYGGSNYNVSLLVKTAHKVEALNALNAQLFKHQLAALEA
ncbi:aspartate kinase [Pseudotenacibaculum sp. MALMAid0570]|uniref:aspartate kinase n=1 Tax=Pseudotenacibaculum sp. MALMAid0570 TaxID=3143938 RepID=UPI0032E035FC